MKFRLYVEGHTEKVGLSEFFKRWLDPKLRDPFGFSTHRFHGSNDLWENASSLADLDLADPKQSELVGIVSILDLAAQLPFPNQLQNVEERSLWGKKYLEEKVGNPKYRHFFAHYELEAWLFSQSAIFPIEVREAVSRVKRAPEKINSDKPPAKLLDEIYLSHTKNRYRKRVNGSQLFAKLDPHIAYEKCPSLKGILDEMLVMARNAGL